MNTGSQFHSDVKLPLVTYPLRVWVSSENFPIKFFKMLHIAYLVTLSNAYCLSKTGIQH